MFNIQTDPAFRKIYDRIWEHLGEKMKEGAL